MCSIVGTYLFESKLRDVIQNEWAKPNEKMKMNFVVMGLEPTTLRLPADGPNHWATESSCKALSFINI